MELEGDVSEKQALFRGVNINYRVVNVKKPKVKTCFFTNTMFQ